MAHLIDKDRILAEIERRIESCAKQREDMLNVQCHTLADDASARMGELNCIQDFINNLEEEVVDLENIIKEEYLKRRCYKGKENMLVILNEPQFNNIAKHFFELGIKARKEEVK